MLLCSFFLEVNYKNCSQFQYFCKAFTSLRYCTHLVTVLLFIWKRMMNFFPTLNVSLPWHGSFTSFFIIHSYVTKAWKPVSLLPRKYHGWKCVLLNISAKNPCGCQRARISQWAYLNISCIWEVALKLCNVLFPSLSSHQHHCVSTCGIEPWGQALSLRMLSISCKMLHRGLTHFLTDNALISVGP